MKKFKTPPSRNFFGKSIDLRVKHKDEGKDIVQEMVKSVMNSLYGPTIRKDIEEEYVSKSEHWMQTEFDDRVRDYWK